MKIGDSLYKYQILIGVVEYKITAIIQRKQSKLYEVICTNCKDNHDDCVILVRKIKGKDYFEFVDMVVDDSENYYDSHEYIHTSNSYKYMYYKTQKEALLATYRSCISVYEIGIKELTEKIKKKKEKKLEVENLILTIE